MTSLETLITNINTVPSLVAAIKNEIKAGGVYKMDIIDHLATLEQIEKNISHLAGRLKPAMSTIIDEEPED